MVVVGDVVIVVVALGTLEGVEDFGKTLMEKILLVEVEGRLTPLHVMFAECIIVYT